MKSYLEGLNLEQYEAVTTTEGYVRVIAGAGSGKTRALTARFAYLVEEMGILPDNILCVTFTNKAAGEMRRRVHNLLGDRDTGHINTFHGFCVTILQEEAYAVAYPKSFLVLDNGDIDGLLSIIYRERGLSLKDMSYKDARDMFEIRKNLTEPGYYLKLTDLSLEELQRCYEEAVELRDILFYGYLYQQKKCFGLDYNDLIAFVLHIFESHPEIARKWQERLEYIMIDEFQDIDPPQVKLMEVLSAYHKNLFIVGDPDQTIYTWRGANVKFLLDFPGEHPGTRTVVMEDNYRSTPEILDTVNSLIAKNRNRFPKALRSHQGSGQGVRAYIGADTAKEALWIADRIEELQAQGCRLGDIAVLYRAHYLSRSIEEELMKRQLPYCLYSGLGFYQRAEVKDALAYLRLIACRDDLSLRRVINVPKRNIGLKRMSFLEEKAQREGKALWQCLLESREEELFKSTGAGELIALVERFGEMAERTPISRLFQELMKDSGYETMLRTEGSQERLDNLAELKQNILQYELSCGEEGDLRDFLTHAALFSEADTPDAEDRLKLMTVHAAKGLEFPFVFLLGMNESVFPAKRTATPEAMEEERRLAFVAMTRAQQGLFLSAVEGRDYTGAPRYLSRFLLDVDPGLLQYDAVPRKELIEDSRQYAAVVDRSLGAGEEPEFAVGTRVRHPIIGEGIIREIDRKRNAYVVEFRELPTPRAISMRAKLEKSE